MLPRLHGLPAWLAVAALVLPAAANEDVFFSELSEDALSDQRNGGPSRVEQVLEYWQDNRQGHTDMYVLDRGVLYLTYAAGVDECRGDYFFPLFHEETLLSRGTRAILYIIALIYAFLGVSIISDIFMSSIEVITSTKKTVVIDGEEITVHVWNDTVANLTLMALGSSAPEILLAVVEAIWQLGLEPEPGKGLGPGTIVGSAAFNLLFIVGVCIMVIPNGEVRRIEQMPVFLVTAFFSIFAYVWMLVTLVWSTPDEITIVEAVVTFLFFPLLVFCAFVADVKFRKSPDAESSGDNKVVPEERVVRMAYKDEDHLDSERASRPSTTYAMNKKDLAVMFAEEKERRKHEGDEGEEGAEKQARRPSIAGGRRQSQQDPHVSHGGGGADAHREFYHGFGVKANKHGKERVPYSRYRIQGIRDMTHGKKVLVTDDDVAKIARAQFEAVNFKEFTEDGMVGPEHEGGVAWDDSVARVSFSSRSYTCPESIGAIQITVVREGNLDVPVAIRYETSSGTATPGEDYEHTFGSLEFAPGVESMSFDVKIVDDDTWEPDEMFFVHLRPAAAAMIARKPSVIPPMADSAQGGRSMSRSTSRKQMVRKPTSDQGELAEASRRAAQGGAGQSQAPAAAAAGSASATTQRAAHGDAPATGAAAADAAQAPPKVPPPKVVLFPYDTAVVTIIDDDKPGTFEFARSHHRVEETADHVAIVVQRRDGSDGEIIVGYRTKEISLSDPVTVNGSPLTVNRAGSSSPAPGGAAGSEPGDAAAAAAAAAYKPVKHGEGFVTFRKGETEATIRLAITPPEPGQLLDIGPVSFQVQLYIPDRLDGTPQGAEVGEMTSTIVTITGDEEVHRVVSQVASAMANSLEAFSVETDTWTEQFKEAVQFKVDDDENIALAATLYVATFGWKVLFSMVPPTSYCNGYATFCAALCMIAVLTAAIGDIASMLGCVIGIPDALSAITIVALGTSLPDFFASKVAAVNDEHADASIGNVTGSNSVNVFLGLGLPWLLSAIYHAARGTKYVVYAGTLTFSVGVFAVCAIIALAVIGIRRLPFVADGELGGPTGLKHASGALFISLWMLYILLSALQAFNLIAFFPAEVTAR